MNEFSFKKLLLTISCSLGICLFLVSTILLFNLSSAPETIVTGMYNDMYTSLSSGEKNDYITYIIDDINNKGRTEVFDNFKKMENNFYNNYGDKAPFSYFEYWGLAGLYISGISKMFVEIYYPTIIIGLFLGLIIYFVFVKKSNYKQLLKELIISFLLLIILLVVIRFLYSTIGNLIYLKSNENNLFNNITFENNYIINYPLIIFIFLGVFIISLLINYFYKLYITKKLNNELK